jgi:hypothetical protein
MESDGTEALWRFEQANAVWPFQIRHQADLAVYKASHEGIGPGVALNALERVLPIDKNSPGIWFFIGIQELRRGDTAKAREALAVLERVAPSWQHADTLRQGIKAVAAQLESNPQ